MQTVMDHAKDTIRRLPMPPDAFSTLGHAALSVDVLELVLRDVPLNAREIDVTSALAEWARQREEGWSDDEDGTQATGSVPFDNNQVADTPIRRDSLGVDQRLLNQIDLQAMSAEELCTVRFLPCVRPSAVHQHACLHMLQ